MVVDDEAIGLVRGHRWLEAKGQVKRLKEAGCVKIFDMDAHDRKDMERIAGRRRVLLVYAFLLADLDIEPRQDEDQAQAIWRDFAASLKRIENRDGQVIDVGTGLDSQQHPAEFRDIVRGQIRRHRQGENPAARKGKPGRQLVTFTAGQYRQARVIWKDVTNYPNYEAVERAFKKIETPKGETFSTSRAFRKWRARPSKRIK